MITKKDIVTSLESIQFRKTERWQHIKDKLCRRFGNDSYEKGEVCYISTRGFYTRINEYVTTWCVRDFIENNLGIKKYEININPVSSTIKVVVEKEIQKNPCKNCGCRVKELELIFGDHPCYIGDYLECDKVKW